MSVVKNDRHQSMGVPRALWSFYTRKKGLVGPMLNRFDLAGLTMVIGGKYSNQQCGSANFLTSDRGAPMDSMIWNW